MYSKFTVVSACLVGLCLTLGEMGEAKNNPAIAVFAAPSPLNMSEPAAAFSLKDQYGATRNYSFPRAKVSVLLFGDREGSEQLEGWIRPLVERFDNRVDVQGVAVLSSVPRVARPVVRRIMKRQVTYPVMLDWSGDVSDSYGYDKGKATLVVIRRDGQVVYKTRGAASSQGLARLYNEINRLL